MKLRIVIYSAILLLLEVDAQTKNYCAPTLCPPGIFHVACTSSNTLAPTCPRDARLPFSLDIRNHFLAEINRVRNQLAFGLEAGLDTAMRMPTVLWDDELARLAEIRCKQCKLGSDPCRNVDRWNGVGQLVYSVLKPVNYINAAVITEAVESWFAPGATMDPAIIDSYVPDETYQSFSVLASDTVTRAGCRYIDYTVGNMKQVTLVCNLNSCTGRGQPIYAAGCPTVLCWLGRNSKLLGLCHPSELVDPNPIVPCE